MSRPSLSGCPRSSTLAQLIVATCCSISCSNLATVSFVFFVSLIVVSSCCLSRFLQCALGKGNFPHLGQVIRYYRKVSGLGKEAFATVLGCTKRYVEMLESDRNMMMPELLSRRILLAKVLQIPPILLGLSSLALGNEVD